MPKLRIILAALTALTLFASCTSYDQLQKERASRAKKGKGDIYIAAVWAKKLFKSFYFEGLAMAVDEINRKGGINGRRLRTVSFYNDTASVDRDLEIAGEIARDCRLVAVLGHYDDDGAIVASVPYEYSGILYLAPACSNPMFTKHGFKYVFRNTPSDEVNGADCAKFLKNRGFGKITVLDDRTPYGKMFADYFSAYAAKIGLKVVGRRSFNRWTSDFKGIFAEVKALDGDGIFLGASLPQAGAVIKQARIMGIKAPFIGGNSINSPTLWDLAGEAAAGTLTHTVFNPEERSVLVQRFTRDFYARHHDYPDTWAAQGYDGIMVLAHIFKKSGTTLPLVVGSHLRFLENWEGVTGKYSFARSGDIVGKINSFQVLQQGKYRHLEVVE